MNNTQKNILAIIVALVPVLSYAQSDRDHVRSGNRFYRQGNYEKAEVEYKKAKEKNVASAVADYNVGNALLMQAKAKDAMEIYEKLMQRETSRPKVARIAHNMGVILQSQKQYSQAIECYKASLRANPSDDETRYNLALCKKLQKNQPEDKDNKDKNNQDKQNQDKQNKDKDKDKKNDKQDNKDQQKQDQNQEKKKQEQQKNEMSKENAEQMLNAAIQNEKQIQERMKRQGASSRKKLQKDW